MLSLSIKEDQEEQQQTSNGTKSEPSDVKSGVPQGTVLGPILFLILINDINDDTDSMVSLFADDTRVSKKLLSEKDVEDLQSDRENLYSWQANNNMQFNGKKFEALRYGKNNEIKESTCYFTPGMAGSIEEKDTIRDLGVIMSSDATFSSHVEAVCSKVRQKVAG